ncbi:MAG TPA: hypothetical protein VGJ16_03705 [Pirellulales bacterium]
MHFPRFTALALNRWAVIGGTLVVVVAIAMALRSEWALLQYRRTIASALNLKPTQAVSAPWKFRAFGEPGYSEIALTIRAEPDTDRMDDVQGDLEKLKRAFPEAQITTTPYVGPNWQERYGKYVTP